MSNLGDRILEWKGELEKHNFVQNFFYYEYFNDEQLNNIQVNRKYKNRQRFSKLDQIAQGLLHEFEPLRRIMRIMLQYEHELIIVGKNNPQYCVKRKFHFDPKGIFRIPENRNFLQIETFKYPGHIVFTQVPDKEVQRTIKKLTNMGVIEKHGFFCYLVGEAALHQEEFLNVIDPQPAPQCRPNAGLRKEFWEMVEPFQHEHIPHYYYNQKICNNFY